jgi:hypothetical protein
MDKLVAIAICKDTGEYTGHDETYDDEWYVRCGGGSASIAGIYGSRNPSCMLVAVVRQELLDRNVEASFGLSQAEFVET